VTTSIDLIPDPVVRLDRDRCIVEANQAAARLVGRSVGELIGEPAASVFAPRVADGTPLVVVTWHQSARLGAVHAHPAHPVAIATASQQATRA
jgi:PAS domain-containing protein